jgi:drug/metabolite transporter (DMT)-like permease
LARLTSAEPATWNAPRPFVPELALIGSTVAYGATFKIVQTALEDVSAVGFILLRFAVGAAVLMPFAFRRGWRRQGADARLTVRDFALGAALFGVVGFAGYWLQNLGLQRTSTSNSAFITGLFVVFTPVIETVVTRRRPPSNVLLAVGISVLGLYLLEGGTLQLGAGDTFTLGCAFMFGLWIFLGGQLSQRFDPVALTTVQLLIFTALAIPVVVVSGLGSITGRVVLAAVVTGVFCSAGAFTLQLWGQRWVEPSRAAVILQFEPIVAGAVGYAVGERLGTLGYVGAVVLFSGIVIAESRVWRSGRGRARLTDRSSTAENHPDD